MPRNGKQNNYLLTDVPTSIIDTSVPTIRTKYNDDNNVLIHCTADHNVQLKQEEGIYSLSIPQSTTQTTTSLTHYADTRRFLTINMVLN